MEFLLFCLLIFILFLYFNSKSYSISKSPIHGYGLFANKSYKKNDIIIKDLFPYNFKRNTLKNLDKDNFNNYILKEGKYINHCNSKANTDLISNDNIYFKLIVLKDIKKGEEILCDYDLVNKRFPFISASKEYYNKC